MKPPLLLPIFFLSCLILFLHLFAISHFFYWTLWWFDILVHFLGGILIAWITVSFFEKKYISPKHSLFLCGVCVPFLISIGWEIFEYVSGITYFSSQYVLDTTLDIGMGVLGGIIGVILSMYFVPKSSSLEVHV